MEKQIELLEQSNAKNQERNRKLSAEIEEFRNGDDAVEERARSDFGMIKRGETFYQVILKPDEPLVPATESRITPENVEKSTDEESTQ